MKLRALFAAAVSSLPSLFADEPPLYPHSKLQEIHFHHTRITDPFWSERIRIIQEKTLPDLFALAEEQGKIDNFRLAAGQPARGGNKIRLYNAPDSDVYKLLEAAAYSLATHPNAALEKQVDDLIALIAAAQQPDGFLNTQYTFPFDHPASPPRDHKHAKTFGYGPDFRWRSLAEEWPRGYSQLYCAGHLFEAAVAHHRATGKRTLLDVALKLADHIASVFTLEKIKTYAEHPQVEIGFMQLYELTRNPRYLELADHFSRYVRFTRPPDLNRAENTKPLAEQSIAIGHAVRTAYIYSGATDVTRATGADDLEAATLRLWQNVIGRKMYVHGGTANGSPAEQHGLDYDLPIGATYSETCAAIAQAQWNHRLNLRDGLSRHADLVELESWNNSLAGISLSGTEYFYSNKLNLGVEKRKNEHSGVRRRYLFCCPSKVPGFVTGLGRWIYATAPATLVVNQFIGSELRTTLDGQPLELEQTTTLPFQGEIRLVIKKYAGPAFNLRLRAPAWAIGPGPIPGGLYRFGPGEAPVLIATINNETIALTPDDDGYLNLNRAWKTGDTLRLTYTLPIRRVYTDEKVAANHGRVALMRGPLIYCLEGNDHTADILSLRLPADAPLTAKFETDLLGGVMTLVGTAQTADGQPTPLRAIPYYAWQNRGIHPLATLLIENPALLTNEQPPGHGTMNTDG